MHHSTIPRKYNLLCYKLIANYFMVPVIFAEASPRHGGVVHPYISRISLCSSCLRVIIFLIITAFARHSLKRHSANLLSSVRKVQAELIGIIFPELVEIWRISGNLTFFLRLIEFQYSEISIAATFLILIVGHHLVNNVAILALHVIF